MSIFAVPGEEETVVVAAAGRRMSPGLIVRAFCVFGTFSVPAAGWFLRSYGYEPSQAELAEFGFVGGIVGAVYAAIFEGRAAGDRR